MRGCLGAGWGRAVRALGIKPMTPSDIQRIEQELDIILPSDYKALLEGYPFPANTYISDYLLLGDADVLIAAARVFTWLPPNSFVIGRDGSESTYFIDLSRESS